MKKIIIVICFIFFITGMAAAQVGPGRTLYVSVKTVSLKSSTGLLAGTVGSLNYGDQVTVTRVEGKSVEVKSSENPSLIGWAVLENFSTRKITQGNSNSVSVSEVALAGKGFNQEVEDSYKTQEDLNYAEVDRVEAIVVDEAELRIFLEEGRLSTGE